MKKVITISLIVLCLATLVACQKEEVKEETTEEEAQEVIEKEEEEVAVLGGWQEAEDQTITSNLQEKFDKAMDGYVGMGFTPTKLLATQVVAGVNYKFLCDAVTVTAVPVESQKIVTIFEDLNGNCKITNVEDVEE